MVYIKKIEDCPVLVTQGKHTRLADQLSWIEMRLLKPQEKSLQLQRPPGTGGQSHYAQDQGIWRPGRETGYAMF